MSHVIVERLHLSLVSLASVFLFGCAPKSLTPWGITESRDNLSRLEIGMTKEQVVGVMGRPYTREVVPDADGNALEYLVYITEYVDGGSIPDSAKTPLCLENGKLIGWGRNFYDRTRYHDVTIHARE